MFLGDWLGRRAMLTPEKVALVDTTRRGQAITYRQTEAGPNTFLLPDAEVRRKAGSVGFPLFHIDARIADAQGVECGPDEVGELLIRGPHVCAGYWNGPEETAKAIQDGWLHTLTFASRRLARFKLPKSVVVVDALPRTGAGKIDKDLLRKVHGQP